MDNAGSPPLPELPITSPPLPSLRYLDDARPDINFAIAFLTMRMFKPTTVPEKLSSAISTTFTMHPDSLAISLKDTGYAFHSKSSPIKTVCCSSTEAQIHAVNEVWSDVLHAVDLLTEIGCPQHSN